MALSFCKITSKYDGDFYCFNCCHSYGSVNQFKKHENVTQIQDYCYIEVPKKVNEILKYNHWKKSAKTDSWENRHLS